MKQGSGVILIHGAGLGSWIWDDISPMLQFPVLAIDFPFRTPERCVDSTFTLNDYATHMIKQVDEWECKEFYLVAHSIGGVLALMLADHYGSKVKGIIGVGAAFPNNKGSFVSTLPFPKRILIKIILRLIGTKPPKGEIIKGLCTELSPAQSEMVVNRFVPESRHLYTDSCQVPLPKCKIGYIKLTKDADYPENLQEKVAGDIQSHQIIPLATGHLPMLDNRHQQELAETINDFVGQK